MATRPIPKNIIDCPTVPEQIMKQHVLLSVQQLIRHSE